MEKISLPKKIEFKKGKNNNNEVVAIEPCYPGYGTTLGNALRRVLLSSLSGAAVTGVKIEGASHEFMTLPHIKEDILEIILNLKQLRLKVFTEKEIKLTLEVNEKKQVTAKDINKDSQVEIVNPELVLANITDAAGNLKMDIYVDQGIGYRPVEQVENKKDELGYIEVDSIFSPVLAIGIDIDNVRVGKMTNWDKLMLNITTDGTITPKEAFEKSVQILIDQFSFLLTGEGEKDSDKDDKEKEEKEEREDEKKIVNTKEKK